jgi:hypothetical protein
MFLLLPDGLLTPKSGDERPFDHPTKTRLLPEDFLFILFLFACTTLIWKD